MVELKENRESDSEISPESPLKEKLEIGEGIEEFDDILEHLGSSGTYQKYLLYGLISPMYFIIALLSNITLFTLFIPEHHCSPDVDLKPKELEKWKQKYIPMEANTAGGNTFSRCKMYSFANEENQNNTLVNCKDGWVFDTQDFDSTISSDNNWVCDKDFYATQVFTVISVGVFIGYVVFGPLADKYGRKPTLFLCLYLNIAFTFLSLFVTHMYYVFMGCILVSAFSFPMMYTLPSLLMAEFCDNAYRPWCYTVEWLSWISAFLVLPWIAYASRTWFLLSLCFLTPSILTFIMYPFLPESPRWLLSMGKINETATILRGLSKINSTSHQITEKDLVFILRKIFNLEKEKDVKILGFWSLFASKRLTKLTVFTTMSSTTSLMIFGLIALNTPYMSGNQFLNFTLLGAIQIPGTILAGYLIRTLGRRWTSVIFGLFTAFLSLMAGTIPKNLTELSLICILLANYVISLQSTELFPTPLRVTSKAVLSTIGSAFALLNPSIVYTGRTYFGAPYLCMFGLSFIGAVAASFLPETLNKHLPETVKDTEDFGAGDKYWSIHPNFQKKFKKSLKTNNEISELQNMNDFGNTTTKE